MAGRTARRGDLHFIGSIPLADADEVFRTLSNRFGDALARMPDGETGNRINWLQFQEEAFGATAGLKAVEAAADYRNAAAQRKQRVQYELERGCELSAGDFPALGYAHAAKAAYASFVRLRAARVVPSGCRFMVALPSPYNVINWAIAASSRAAVEPAYEERLLRELDEICRAIPAADLSVQWDCAHDMQAFDGARTPWFEPAGAGIIERLVRIGNRVPPAVELGYHLCYGSFGGRHFVEPADTGAMVRLAGGLLAGIGRTVQFVHMPVPVDRIDNAYVAPLAGLRLGAETRLYLGLVHASDSLERVTQRVQTARQFVADFGVAAECGFGRTPASELPRLLNAHQQALAVLRA